MSKNPSTNSPKKPDDLKAVRIIRDALIGFQNDDRERIIRWVRESLGLSLATPREAAGGQSPRAQPIASHPTPISAPPTPATTTTIPSSSSPKNIATFVSEKNPQTDIQLATTVAYYYRFEAPPNDRKDEIDAAILRDALRLAGRPGKLTKPLMTLNNAHAKGLLDRGSERGKFAINAVGENLVGMTLPGGGTAQPSRARGRRSNMRKKPARPQR
jgi:hypothetical protein